VDVEFTLAAARGHASDLKVVGSSLSERLDAAGREFVNAVDFSTPCPGTRYTLRVRFQLND
jgi:outer membrane biosynthesis protein TonB